MANAGNVDVNIRANSSQFVREMRKVDRGVRGVQKQLQGLARTAGGLAAAFGVIQIGKFAGELIDTGDRLNKLNIRLGVSVGALQRLGFAAEQAGSSVETLAKALELQSDNIVEAVRGTKAQADAFRNLGINAAELVDLAPDKAFLRIAAALRQVSSDARRINLARDIFGRSGPELIPLLTADLEALTEQSREWGNLTNQQAAQLADVNDALNEMTTSLTQQALVLVGDLAPAISATIRLYTNLMTTLKDASLSGLFRGAVGLGNRLGGHTLPTQGVPFNIARPGAAGQADAAAIVDAALGNAAAGPSDFVSTPLRNVAGASGGGRTGTAPQFTHQANASATLFEFWQRYNAQLQAMQSIGEDAMRGITSATRETTEALTEQEQQLMGLSSAFSDTLLQSARRGFNGIRDMWGRLLQDMILDLARSQLAEGLFGGLGGLLGGADGNRNRAG